jgi:AcrR family transcriptional regulator
MSADTVPRTRPRERILETARDLFHRSGIRAVGVEAIAEAAGTNKMTLYRHFGSKDDLIAECLRDVGRQTMAVWRDLEERYPADKRAQLHGWIEEAATCVVADGRGCDLANAAVELTEPNHPARRIVEDFKTDHRNHLVELCRAAGIERAELLADTLCLLLEGARVSRQSVGRNGPSAKFPDMAHAVIAAFVRPG